MKKKSASVVSLSDIAKTAGLSKAAVCYALRNSRGVSPATRGRVLRIARQLGYVPDARIAAQMKSVRGAGTRDLLPIAWLNTTAETDTWQKQKWLSPYLEGAQERALSLGYRIDEVWTNAPGLTMKRVAGMLYQRGIEGAIVTYPARHTRLNWTHLAAVSLEGALLAPPLHRVLTDAAHNLLLALKMLNRAGYRRIGICFEEAVDRCSVHSIRAASHYFYATTPKALRIPPLFYTGDGPEDWVAAKKIVASWLSRHEPEALVCHTQRMVACVEEAGYRVPEDIGIVHLATDDDVPDWAGICSKKRQIGAAAVELVVSLMGNRQFGVPETATDTLVRGVWHPGRTLLTPRSHLQPVG
ncbi:MAG: LacI family DNA-binding transcriptional regulator [Terrimicrobiaceae bacterium]